MENEFIQGDVHVPAEVFFADVMEDLSVNFAILMVLLDLFVFRISFLLDFN